MEDVRLMSEDLNNLLNINIKDKFSKVISLIPKGLKIMLKKIRPILCPFIYFFHNYGRTNFVDTRNILTEKIPTGVGSSYFTFEVGEYPGFVISNGKKMITNKRVLNLETMETESSHDWPNDGLWKYCYDHEGLEYSQYSFFYNEDDDNFYITDIGIDKIEIEKMSSTGVISNFTLNFSDLPDMPMPGDPLPETSGWFYEEKIGCPPYINSFTNKSCLAVVQHSRKRLYKTWEEPIYKPVYPSQIIFQKLYLIGFNGEIVQTINLPNIPVKTSEEGENENIIPWDLGGFIEKPIAIGSQSFSPGQPSVIMYSSSGTALDSIKGRDGEYFSNSIYDNFFIGNNPVFLKKSLKDMGYGEPSYPSTSGTNMYNTSYAYDEEEGVGAFSLEEETYMQQLFVDFSGIPLLLYFSNGGSEFQGKALLVYKALDVEEIQISDNFFHNWNTRNSSNLASTIKRGSSPHSISKISNNTREFFISVFNRNSTSKEIKHSEEDLSPIENNEYKTKWKYVEETISAVKNIDKDMLIVIEVSNKRIKVYSEYTDEEDNVPFTGNIDITYNRKTFGPTVIISTFFNGINFDGNACFDLTEYYDDDTIILNNASGPGAPCAVTSNNYVYVAIRRSGSPPPAGVSVFGFNPIPYSSVYNLVLDEPVNKDGIIFTYINNPDGIELPPTKIFHYGSAIGVHKPLSGRWHLIK